MDPAYATNAFYDELVELDGYQDMRITEAAQAVQRSGFPEAYEEHAEGARALASALTGWSPAKFSCVADRADGPRQPEAASGLTPRAEAVRTDLEQRLRRRCPSAASTPAAWRPVTWRARPTTTVAPSTSSSAGQRAQQTARAGRSPTTSWPTPPGWRSSTSSSTTRSGARARQSEQGWRELPLPPGRRRRPRPAGHPRASRPRARRRGRRRLTRDGGPARNHPSGLRTSGMSGCCRPSSPPADTGGTEPRGTQDDDDVDALHDGDGARPGRRARATTCSCSSTASGSRAGSPPTTASASWSSATTAATRWSRRTGSLRSRSSPSRRTGARSPTCLGPHVGPHVRPHVRPADAGTARPRPTELASLRPGGRAQASRSTAASTRSSVAVKAIRTCSAPARP